MPKRKYDRSRRAELQRMLGEHGTVHPRVMHGSPARPAQGWYATMHAGPRAGEDVFLGDYTMLAGFKISQLLKDLTAEPKPRRRPTRKAANA